MCYDAILNLFYEVNIVYMFSWCSTEPSEYQHTNKYSQSVLHQELGWSHSWHSGVTEEGMLRVLLRICSRCFYCTAPYNGTSTFSAVYSSHFYTTFWLEHVTATYAVCTVVYYHITATSCLLAGGAWLTTKG